MSCRLKIFHLLSHYTASAFAREIFICRFWVSEFQSNISFLVQFSPSRCQSQVHFSLNPHYCRGSALKIWHLDPFCLFALTFDDRRLWLTLVYLSAWLMIFWTFSLTSSCWSKRNGETGILEKLANPILSSLHLNLWASKYLFQALALFPTDLMWGLAPSHLLLAWQPSYFIQWSSQPQPTWNKECCLLISFNRLLLQSCWGYFRSLLLQSVHSWCFTCTLMF